MASLPICSFNSESSTCHTQSFTTKTTIRAVSREEKHLLGERVTGINKIHTIYAHHEQMHLTRYSYIQKSCCDPYNDHKDASGKSVKGRKALIIINKTMYSNFAKPVTKM